MNPSKIHLHVLYHGILWLALLRVYKLFLFITWALISDYLFSSIFFPKNYGQKTSHELNNSKLDKTDIHKFCTTSVVMKRELSKKAKPLSIFKAVFVLILAYGHESWVMNGRVYGGPPSSLSREGPQFPSSLINYSSDYLFSNLLYVIKMNSEKLP